MIVLYVRRHNVMYPRAVLASCRMASCSLQLSLHLRKHRLAARFADPAIRFCVEMHIHPHTTRHNTRAHTHTRVYGFFCICFYLYLHISLYLSVSNYNIHVSLWYVCVYIYIYQRYICACIHTHMHTCMSQPGELAACALSHNFRDRTIGTKLGSGLRDVCGRGPQLDLKGCNVGPVLTRTGSLLCAVLYINIKGTPRIVLQKLRGHFSGVQEPQQWFHVYQGQGSFALCVLTGGSQELLIIYLYSEL